MNVPLLFCYSLNFENKVCNFEYSHIIYDITVTGKETITPVRGSNQTMTGCYLENQDIAYFANFMKYHTCNFPHSENNKLIESD